MTRDAGEAMTSCGKLHPGSKRRTDIFKTQGLPAQPKVIMGSGLVGQRGDSGQAVLADVEEREEWMGTHRDSEGPVERPCFDHPVFKHPEVRGHTRRRSNLVGNVCKTLQSTQT